MQNDIKALLACCHTCPSGGIVRSNCTLLIAPSYSPLFGVYAQIFMYAFITKLLHPRDTAKELICMPGAFLKGASQQQTLLHYFVKPVTDISNGT